MSRGLTVMHVQTGGDLGFTVQFNAEMPWPFAQHRYPNGKHSIADSLKPYHSHIST